MAMTTTKRLLPAINSLYKIELNPKQLDQISNNMETIFRTHIPALKEDEVSALAGYDKLRRSNMKDLLEHTFYVHRSGDILLSTCVESATNYQTDKETITLTKLHNQEECDKYDKYLKDGESKYAVSFDNSASIHKGRELTWFDELPKEDLETLSDIRYLFYKLYDCPSGLKTLNTYRVRNEEETKQWESVSDLKEAFKKDLLENSTKLNEQFKAREVSIANIIRLMQSLFPDALVTKKSLSKEMATKIRTEGHARFIMSVLEVDNYRFSFVVKQARYHYYENSDGGALDARMVITSHEDPIYNYVDAGRLVYTGERRNYDVPYRPIGDLFCIADEPVVPKIDILHDYLKGNSATIHFLDNDQLALIAKRYLQKQNRIKAEDQAKRRLEKKIADKITSIKTKGKELKINDVVYTNDQITYHDQILKVTGGLDNWVHNLLRYQTGAYSLDSITFDHIFAAFISRTQVEYGEYGRPGVDFEQGQVGNVSFDITTQSTTNVNNVTSYRFYINGYRVNAKEVHKCIERAICFENQSDYDYFLKSVSSCSLKMHRYLQLGVDITVRDYFDNTEVVLKFPLERNKNLNYLVLNDNEYRIRNTEKVLRLERAETIMEIINTLLGGQVIEGINADDVRDVIDAGKQAYIDAIAKSKELLEHCEKVLGVQKEPIRLKDGKEFTGYRIEGQYRTYAVNANDERYSVYDIDTAQYICIVDKTNAAQAGLDRLVNRLFALHNDSRVATQINTLKRRS